MAFIDYFVCTMPRLNVVEAVEPRLQALVKDGERVVRSGYRGLQKSKIFFGYHDIAMRWLLIATGDGARDVTSLVPETLDPYLSVARIDVQETFVVDERADDFISALEPSARYQARLLKNLKDAGSTMYVGSPRSILQARCYNKSAEAGVLDADGREFVRVEFVLRDRYADRAWAMARDEKIGDAWRALVTRMFAETSADVVLSRVERGSASFDAQNERSDDVVSRRLCWLEHVVIPALNKMMAKYPDSIDSVWRALEALARPE